MHCSVSHCASGHNGDPVRATMTCSVLFHGENETGRQPRAHVILARRNTTRRLSTS